MLVLPLILEHFSTCTSSVFFLGIFLERAAIFDHEFTSMKPKLVLTGERSSAVCD